MEAAVKAMKMEKSLGTDSIAAESVKAGGEPTALNCQQIPGEKSLYILLSILMWKQQLKQWRLRSHSELIV